MIFYSSDIKVLATITDIDGNSSTISIQIRTAKRGLFKEEIERQILDSFNGKLVKKIIKVKVH